MSDPNDFYSLFDRKEQPHRDLTNVTPIDPERASRYARKALQSECENVAAAPEGQRNHTLNRAAFSISQLVAAGHVYADVAWNSLRDAALSAGLGEVEIERTIKSGMDAGAQQPRVVAELPLVPDPSVLDIRTGPDTEAGEGPPLNPVLDWHALFAADEDEEEWIVEPILPARRMVALYSAPKAGKSLLMLELAVGITRGTEVLGHVLDRPRRVLYVDFENDPRGDVRTRLEAMSVGPDDLEGLMYLSFPQLAKFDTAQGALDLLYHVEQYACEVVVIDTVSRAVMGDENENDTWLALYRHTGLALKRAGVACIRLDHSGKDAEKGMRGGSAKAGDVDMVWQLTAVSDETVVLDCTHHRMQVPEKRLTLVREEWPLRHVVAGNPLAAVADARAREIDQLLDALGVPSSASVKDAGTALRDAGHRFRQDAVASAVRVRKLRLDVPTPSVTVTPGNAGVTGSVRALPDPPPLGGRGNALSDITVMPLPDPDLLVSCKSCFKPTTHAVAEANGGLCAGCFRDTGQEPT
jgi:hypothetical protein